ncbi:MAG TPA: putative monovalent cation/H+ antiporter subunit A [Candidatus Thermoplasmatota archaeon]|nr:putative monovalent cation/H+ antiporter subunit A [Candidatus Thermoplasmatota archaeon]
MELLAVVLSPFLLALAAPLLVKAARGAVGWVIALLPAAILAYLLTHGPTIAGGGAIHETHAWVPGLGISLSFTLDGLSLLFCLLITGIGTLIMIYGGGYLHGHRDIGRFYAAILAFMGAMLGVVLSGNLVALFVFWELTSISSYILIGFNHNEEKSRKSALQALLVTGGGGLALLAGFLLMGIVGGSLDLPTLLQSPDVYRDHALYVPILLLVLLGAFTKSAQFPFHFWLPGAMAAPTPVSAYLHSATMVKAGIYLLARLSPLLSGTDLWYTLVAGAGAITALVGAYLALHQRDLKLLLAYSTVSALGTLTLLLGVGTPTAVSAAMVLLLAHGLYKGALFQVAGAIDHETGTRDVDTLGGLRRVMPLTFAAAILAALSLAGLAPLFSFIGKELLLEALIHAPRGWPVLLAASLLTAMFLTTVALVVGIRPFVGKAKPTPKTPHEGPVSLWLGPLLLAILGLLIGLFPRFVDATLVHASAAAVLLEPADVELVLWHGFTPALGLSLVTLTGGILLYLGWDRWHHRITLTERALEFGPSRLYELGLAGLNGVAKWQTRLLQHGYLRYYLFVTLAVTVALAGYTLFAKDAVPAAPALGDTRVWEWGIALLIVLGALGTTVARGRLTAIACLGVTGYGVALFFVMYGAPDLAMTQFLIETLTVLLFVLVFYHLPRFQNLTSRSTKARDAALAIGAGALMTALVLAALAAQYHATIAGYFAENSKVVAHGRNIVNVILVDFRGFDTMGEITVLAVAALGVYSLLKLRARRKEGEG